LERSEYLWMLHDLLSEVAIRTDGKHAIAPLRQLASHHLIPGCLLWVIMHRPVTKNTDVRGVEKIWNAARFGNRLLCLVRQALVANGQEIEEATLKV
jgi:hypothetical protein